MIPEDEDFIYESYGHAISIIITAAIADPEFIALTDGLLDPRGVDGLTWDGERWEKSE